MNILFPHHSELGVADYSQMAARSIARPSSYSTAMLGFQTALGGRLARAEPHRSYKQITTT